MKDARSRGNKYSFADHAPTRQAGRPGDYTTAKNAGVQIWSPSWNRTHTVFRPFPVVDDEGNLSPYRNSSDPNDFGDWVRRYPAAVAYGEERVTFLLGDPSDDDFELAHTPAYRLWQACKRAIDRGVEKPGWAKLVTGDRQGKALSKPSSLTFMQGCLYAHGDKSLISPPRGSAPDHSLLVLQLKPSAADSLFTLLNERNDVDSDDWEVSMVHGDPVAPAHGRFFDWFQLGSDTGADEVDDFAKPQSSSNREAIGYGCQILKEYQRRSPHPEALRDVVNSKVKPWSQVLRILDHEEQIRLLAKHFPANLILYAFSDTPELIPDGVRQQAVGQRSFQAPALGGRRPDEAAAARLAAPGVADRLSSGLISGGSVPWADFNQPADEESEAAPTDLPEWDPSLRDDDGGDMADDIPT